MLTWPPATLRRVRLGRLAAGPLSAARLHAPSCEALRSASLVLMWGATAGRASLSSREGREAARPAAGAAGSDHGPLTTDHVSSVPGARAPDLGLPAACGRRRRFERPAGGKSGLHFGLRRRLEHCHLHQRDAVRDPRRGARERRARRVDGRAQPRAVDRRQPLQGADLARAPRDAGGVRGRRSRARRVPLRGRRRRNAGGRGSRARRHRPRGAADPGPAARGAGDHGADHARAGLQQGPARDLARDDPRPLPRADARELARRRLPPHHRPGRAGTPPRVALARSPTPAA